MPASHVSLRFILSLSAAFTLCFGGTVLAQNVTLKSGGITRNGWTNEGPANVGGRVTAILTHPTNANIIYVGSSGGGIWKTTNGGSSWQSLTDNFFPSLVVSCLAMDPTNPNVIYAGTGDYFNPGGVAGAGLFKTTNGGTTWTNLISSTSSGQAYWSYINDLAISPTNPNVLLAALYDGLGRSTDGGVTWSIILGENHTYDVDFHPTDGNKAIATGGDQWSTTDGGLTWTNISPQINQIASFAYARSNPSIIYCVGPSNADNVGALSASVDGGQTFVVRSPVFIDLTGRNHSLKPLLWVDPTNSNNILAGAERLWRSIDGGFNWTLVAEFGQSIGHHDAVQASDFATTRKVYIGNDNGIFRANDFLTADTDHPLVSISAGLRIAPILRGAAHGSTGRILTSTRENGTWLDRDATPNWVKGERSGVWGDIVDDLTVGTDGMFDMYAFRTPWSVVRQRFNADGSYFGAVYSAGPGQDVNAHESNAPLIGSGDFFYLGGRSVWRASILREGGSTAGTWFEVKPPLDGGFETVSALANSPANLNEMWVGYNGSTFTGLLFKSTNATNSAPTWTNVTLSSWDRFSRVNKVVVNPASNSVYAVLESSAWKTTDGGTTWTELTGQGDLPLINDLLVHPTMPNRLYLANDQGVLASENGGQTWSTTTLGPINGRITDLFFDRNILMATTDGRGLFSIVPDPNRLPEVALTNPVSDTTFVTGNFVTAEATAIDADGTVAKVEFYADGALLGTDTTVPYAFTWNNPPAGTHTLSAVATDNLGGQTLSNLTTIKVVAGTSAKRIATADAYVRGGTNAGANFGTATVLEVKTSPAAPSNARDAYFKFDVSGLTGFAHQVRFRVTGNLNTAGAATAAAFGVANTTWGETSINWNNRPPLGALLATRPVYGSPAAGYVFDVTQYVRQARAAGATTISLALHMAEATNPHFRVNSRENTVGKPEIELLTSTQNVLFVVGNTTLNTGDAAILSRLQKMGFSVTVKAATAAVSADANGKALVFVSSTVTSGNVNTKFRDTTTPVVNSEPSIQDDMRMTGQVGGVDFGTLAGRTQIEVGATGHPLEAGLTGVQTISTVASALGWGNPDFDAVHAAYVTGIGGGVGIYGYEKGAPMVGQNAPARRVQLPLGDATAATLTPAGWALFDAAVYWAVEL